MGGSCQALVDAFCCAACPLSGVAQVAWPVFAAKDFEQVEWLFVCGVPPALLGCCQMLWCRAFLLWLLRRALWGVAWAAGLCGLAAAVRRLTWLASVQGRLWCNIA